ncbi:histone-lysine N-trimethyltransferase SMYD5 isoform X1 [Hydra vulgaris]|uniref:SET and MYND domain-containing protein 5 n=1 Tax=Hydra vulgaris TaxID=6087 RepID=T2MBL7_HYDVU|nr:histone-lysine N-trimethyltransferase SMYD5 [Hydra vulgaris]
MSLIEMLASDNVYVKETLSKGKGLFAASAIKKGDTILTEKPLVLCQFSWNRQYNYVACDYCMRSLETAQNMARRLAADYTLELPYHEQCSLSVQRVNSIYKCPNCCIPFCSKECYSEAYEKYHKSLCLHPDEMSESPVYRIEEAWKQLHYPPETASVMLIVRILAMIAQSQCPEMVMSEFQQFFSKTKNEEHKITHKLLGNKFKEQIILMHSLLQEIVPTGELSKLLTISGVQSLFALIGMNGQGIGTSSLSEYVHNIDAKVMSDNEREQIDAFIDQLYLHMEKESGSFLNCEGSGLFKMQSRCNHSCYPNAEATFPYNNSTLVLVATEDITKDEEICVCYLDECQRSRSRHSRRKLLRENYLFECTCSLCESEVDHESETSSDDSEMSEDASDS